MNSQDQSLNAHTLSPCDMDYEFLDINGERFVCIKDLEKISTFFVSMVSAEDHWFFTATNGALSAGRGSPQTALFPYYTVDKIINNWNCTGPQTVIKLGNQIWEPFKPASQRSFKISRKIFKSINGDTLIFEETNLDFQVSFCYKWSSSEAFGFVREAKLENLSETAKDLLVIDGLTDFLASSVDDRTQLAYSCLTDAYKVSELDASKQLLVHRMVASLVDEAIPLECLKATTLWSYGWESAAILVQSSDIDCFLSDPSYKPVNFVRGQRGAFLKAGTVSLNAKESLQWAMVADIDQTQSQVAQLCVSLEEPKALWDRVQADILKGRQSLEKLIQSSDGLQLCSEEIVSTYHRANVLFNIMRGGVFSDNYKMSKRLFQTHLIKNNNALAASDHALIEALNDSFSYDELVQVSASGSSDLKRICNEYLPLVFSRRHGDPSRPWNRFNIQTKDSEGNEIVGFQGNWRDIFQNWEALAWSFPKYNETFIHKFLNASTADGYNPYRITDGGIEWEEPDPEDPWASIGYWGDHQIIYLLKLLEFSVALDSEALHRLLYEDLFVFADVPYEIKDFAHLEVDPNHSIHFNDTRNVQIKERFEKMGADGKLVHNSRDSGGQILKANLLEKLLIPFLVKLSNYVPNGGIWMNTQRPEWNDANNALAGFGLSMVTTYYMHRYLDFIDDLITDQNDFSCYGSIKSLLEGLSQVFEQDPESISKNASEQYRAIQSLGLSGEQYRKAVYQSSLGDREVLSVQELKAFLSKVRQHLSVSIEANLRDDGLYHAYNILHLDKKTSSATVEHLGPMLEGQVAVLSSKAIAPEAACALLKALKKSPLYCEKRNSYILYADKQLPHFLDYNQVSLKSAQSIGLLSKMIESNDSRIIEGSPEGCYRFNSELRNRFELKERLDSLKSETSLTALIEADEEALLDLYEATFNHKEFTGRSGSMFAYEGLGSIYWHMVSKLMLAVQEIALENTQNPAYDQLVYAYYDVQNGLGFRKKAADYGAFTADAYSHTPSFAGAQQPGLTGMVKEGVICRFNELGIQFNQGTIAFKPELLKRSELLAHSVSIDCILPNKSVQTVAVPEKGLLFTITQTPVVYKVTDATEPSLEIVRSDGSVDHQEGAILNAEDSESLLSRQTKILSITVHQPATLFID
jgi:hypothetical protein